MLSFTARERGSMGSISATALEIAVQDARIARKCGEHFVGSSLGRLFDRRSALTDFRQVGAQFMGKSPRAQADGRALEQRDGLLVLFIELLPQSNEVGAGLGAICKLGLHTVHRRDRAVGDA